MSDRWVQNREKIEEHLRQRHGELFGLDRAVLPYDLTNRHFAGIGVGSAKAKRGKNKHKRDDCVQIVVGMVFATEGFEAGPSDLCGQPEKPDREAVQEPGQQSCEDNAHVLRPNRNHFSRAEPWRLYMTLSRAEKGFKALKCNLGLRPNHHQIERRVEGNLFITILTYLLLRLIEGTLEQQGVSRCWPTIKRILQTHTYATLILPTGHGEVYRLPKEGLGFRIDLRILSIDHEGNFPQNTPGIVWEVASISEFELGAESERVCKGAPG